MIKRLSTLLILPIVTACTVHPDYIKPNLDSPEAWQTNIPHGGNVDNLNDWWAQFNDPTLIKLLAASQLNNPSLDKAVASIQLSRANLKSAKAQAKPSIGGVVSADERKSGNAGGSGTIESRSARIDAGWELDLFGRVGFGNDAAQARVDADTLAWHEARVSLAAEVATNYVNYRACVLTVNTLKKALVSKKETARITQISADAGFTAPADALLANASAGTSYSAVVGQQAACDLSVKTLVALTNLPEEAVRLSLSENIGLPTPAQFDVESLPANLIRQRPDLVADERRLMAANADIGLAKTALYPSISLNGSIGYQSTVFNGISFKTNTWSFGPTLNLPIFDGGRNKAQVKVAEANFNTALATYKQDVRNAIKEVEVALVNLNSATKRAEIESQSNTQYVDYFKAAELNWQSGGLDLLALEDARRQMINAQTSLITQQQNRVLYWIALYKAFGGDWQSEDNTQEITP